MSKYGTIDANKLSKAERDLLQADRPGYGSHTKLSVALNLVNAIVGAGIIGLPFAIAHAGFAVGILASILAAVLAQIGMYMLVFSGQRVGIYKYALLVEYMMGRFGYHFLNLIVLVQAGGGTIGYFILLGDSLPALLQQYLPQFPLLANRNVLLVFVGVFCVSCPSKMGS
jgi:sodium-coupled neutral amino acid transporter 11